MTKTCTRCFIDKDLSKFHNSKKGKLGRKPRCKKCSSLDAKAYNDNRDYVRSDERKEYEKEYSKAYRIKNKENRQKYLIDNRDKLLSTSRKYYKNNEEHLQEINKKFKLLKRYKLSIEKYYDLVKNKIIVVVFVTDIEMN